MKKIILVGFIGLVLGVAGTLGTILATGQTVGGYGLGLSGRQSDQALARTLTGRLAGSFVGAEKVSRKGRLQWAAFYDTPRPIGRNLCRVNRYLFVGAPVDGRSPRPENEGVEGLTTSVGYVIAPEGESVAARERFCRRYRTFSRLISVSNFPYQTSGSDEGTLDRVVDILRQAKDPRATLAGTCRDLDGPCNLREELAAIDVRRIVLVTGGPIHNEDVDFSHTDSVLICRDAACRRRMTVTLKSRYSPREVPSNQNHLISIDLNLAMLLL